MKETSIPDLDTSTKELTFTGINYEACNYCRHIAIGQFRDGNNSGCSKQIVDGKYEPMIWGCEQLEPSGLPIHPQVLEELVKHGEFIRRVPVDKNATETSWDFDSKMLQYSHVDCDYALNVRNKP